MIVYLEQAAKTAFPEEFTTKLRRLFILDTPADARSMQAPLTRAMFSRNDVLLQNVYMAYEKLCGNKRWTCQQVRKTPFIRRAGRCCHNIASTVERDCFSLNNPFAQDRPGLPAPPDFAGPGTDTRRGEQRAGT